MQGQLYFFYSIIFILTLASLTKLKDDFTVCGRPVSQGQITINDVSWQQSCLFAWLVLDFHFVRKDIRNPLLVALHPNYKGLVNITYYLKEHLQIIWTYWGNHCQVNRSPPLVIQFFTVSFSKNRLTDEAQSFSFSRLSCICVVK